MIRSIPVLNVLLGLMVGHLLGLIIFSFFVRKAESIDSKQRLAKFLLLYSALAAPLAIAIVVVA